MGVLYWYYKTEGGKKPGGCLADVEYSASPDRSILDYRPLLLLNKIKPSSIRFGRDGDKGWATQASYSFSF